MHLRRSLLVTLVWAVVSITASVQDPSTTPQEPQEVDILAAQAKEPISEKQNQGKAAVINPLPGMMGSVCLPVHRKEKEWAFADESAAEPSRQSSRRHESDAGRE
ncbi:MAG: hypothetical protein LQ343_002794 [Gyalolechia ehrenbergii]|nr:MAG: hypothetical protein LQ343_002794 [Gyalolechia ehrenbergii]